jgi:hypothetical protein
MTMAARLPTMPDADLASLRANAIRLFESGSAKQKTQAEELLPLVEAEVQARIAAKPPKKSAAKPRVSKAKAKPAAKVEEEAEA